MKTKLWKRVVFSFFTVLLLKTGVAEACPTCPPPPPPPCDGCPPDESVPFDSGLAFVFAGAAALGITKVISSKKSNTIRPI